MGWWIARDEAARWALLRDVLEAAASTSGDDEWRLDERRGGDNGVCSYCGSLHPDDFMAAARAGCELGPTDKGYKVYVDLPEGEPDELRVSTATIGEEHPGWGGEWRPVDDEIRAMLKRDGWGSDEYTWVQLVPRGPIRHCKFYFPHLTAEQRLDFIDLLVGGRLTIGYPGHFYVKPSLAVPPELRRS